jgi:hypothetical protein
MSETKTVATDLIHVREVRIRSGGVYYVPVLYIALLISPPITIPPHYTSASKTYVHKIIKVPVFYMELLLNDFEAGRSIIPSIGRGGPALEIQFFWAQMAVVGISGPKKASISSAHPFQNGPRN